MSRMCPYRRESLHTTTSNARPSGFISTEGPGRVSQTGKLFSDAVSHQLPIPVCADIISKSVTCILLASLKNIERAGSFSAELNNLLAINSLPNHNLEGFSPPAPPGLVKPPEPTLTPSAPKENESASVTPLVDCNDVTGSSVSPELR